MIQRLNSVFWPSDTESCINELRFSDSVSLSFKTRLTSVTCFCRCVTLSKFQAWYKRRKHYDVTSRNVTLWQTFPHFLGLKTKQVLKSERISEKRHIINTLS